MIDRARAPAREVDGSRVRIGAVSYLNSKPLIEGLEHFAPCAELQLDLPSRLADRLARGNLEVGLIPSIELFSDPDYEVVSDACVATRGPVRSVKLYFRVPPGDVRSLAIDEGSRTSVALSRIMLAERFGVVPALEPIGIKARVEQTHSDAVLLIGDRAMHPPRETFVAVWDLGAEWLAWTGLPFVFAMWVARSETPLGDLPASLESAREFGIGQIAKIARREAPRLGLPVIEAETYLRRNLHFRLGSAERNGLQLFHQLARDLELVPTDSSVRFRSETSRLPLRHLALPEAPLPPHPGSAGHCVETSRHPASRAASVR